VEIVGELLGSTSAHRPFKSNPKDSWIEHLLLFPLCLAGSVFVSLARWCCFKRRRLCPPLVCLVKVGGRAVGSLLLGCCLLGWAAVRFIFFQVVGFVWGQDSFLVLFEFFFQRHHGQDCFFCHLGVAAFQDKGQPL